MQNKKDTHFISVIIPTFGRDSLVKVQTALDVQTRLPDEVIISIDEQRRGTSWARNAGIARSRGDLIVSLDDDTVPPPHWLETMVTVLDELHADVVGGTYIETDPMLAIIRKRRGALPDVATVDTSGLTGIGGNTMYRRELLERCLREDGYIFVGLGEDIDLAGRLRRRGAVFAYIPVPLMHLKRLSSGGFLKYQFTRGKHIAVLEFAYRTNRSEPIQNSLLWSHHGWHKWALIAWRKLLGPFDVRSFPTWRNFGLFWLGEKAQGFGYIAQRSRRILGRILTS